MQHVQPPSHPYPHPSSSLAHRIAVKLQPPDNNHNNLQLIHSLLAGQKQDQHASRRWMAKRYGGHGENKAAVDGVCAKALPLLLSWMHFKTNARGEPGLSHRQKRPRRPCCLVQEEDATTTKLAFEGKLTAKFSISHKPLHIVSLSIHRLSPL